MQLARSTNGPTWWDSTSFVVNDAGSAMFDVQTVLTPEGVRGLLDGLARTLAEMAASIPSLAIAQQKLRGIATIARAQHL